MSWNPRRLVNAITNKMVTDDTTAYLWLTEESVGRVLRCIRDPEFTYTDVKIPEGGLAIGLKRPMHFPVSEGAVDVMHVPAEIVRASWALALDLSDLDDLPPAVFTYTQSVTDHVAVAAMDMRTGDNGVWKARADDPDEDVVGIASKPLNLLPPDEAGGVLSFMHAAWTLFNSPTEREISATTASPQRVTVGKKRKARDYDVTVIDINAPLIEREPSGEHRHVDWQFQWGVRPHTRRIWSTDENGNRVRRVIPVKGHRKGPKDKPFKDRKVYQL